MSQLTILNLPLEKNTPELLIKLITLLNLQDINFDTTNSNIPYLNKFITTLSKHSFKTMRITNDEIRELKKRADPKTLLKIEVDLLIPDFIRTVYLKYLELPKYVIQFPNELRELHLTLQDDYKKIFKHIQHLKLEVFHLSSRFVDYSVMSDLVKLNTKRIILDELIM